MSIKKTYLEVYTEHSGFVSHKWIHYFFIYDSIFKRFLEKEKPIKMLEIGVQNGGSLEIWKKYLPQGSIIHGLDIDKKCQLLKFSEDIFFHLGNATDFNFMEKTFGDTQFDVIIDDGSHVCKDVIQTFKYLFPKMKSGGCYIVEDMHTSYWKRFGGRIYGKKSSIEYFKNLIDCGVNRDYVQCDFFSKIKSKIHKQYNSDLEILKNISQISFFDSICSIDKFYEPKDFSFKNVISGEVALVDKEPIELSITINDRRNEITKTEKLFCG
ncbi:MAG: class I SAM-dependent methyltransferase [Fibromonadaceae bacterium]|nr:class I SAM-dependent methyltransferase [Fibromonadaceae bacterium]